MSRKNKRESLSFELTPLIDVVFLLLIFFMVSSVFKKDELALLLNLPTAKEGQGESKLNKQITIELNQDHIAFNGKKIEINQLTALLESEDRKKIVNLRSDGKVLYQRLVEVLDILGQQKFHNISLITEKEGDKK